MSSIKIEELKQKRQKEYKRKRNQVKYGLIIVCIIIFILIKLSLSNTIHGIIWTIGILIGITLQRSRFCFAAGFRDPVLVGSTSILKAIIIGLIITTIGFGLIQLNYLQDNTMDINNIPGQIYPVGTNTIIGAILFGVGMVIAGGCASGTLMRIGEGFMLQVVVLIGFIIGTLLGAHNFKFWDTINYFKTTIYLPKFIKLPYLIVGQVVLLLILYFLAHLYHEKNNRMI